MCIVNLGFKHLKILNLSKCKVEAKIRYERKSSTQRSYFWSSQGLF